MKHRFQLNSIFEWRNLILVAVLFVVLCVIGTVYAINDVTIDGIVNFELNTADNNVFTTVLGQPGGLVNEITVESNFMDVSFDNASVLELDTTEPNRYFRVTKISGSNDYTILPACYTTHVAFAGTGATVGLRVEVISTPPSCSNPPPGPGPGPSPIINPPSVIFPTGAVVINNGDACTATPAVSLSLSATNANAVKLSNNLNFIGANWQSFSGSIMTKSWTLDSGSGPKTVYALYKSPTDNYSPIVSDTINLNASTCNVVPPAEEPPPVEPPTEECVFDCRSLTYDLFIVNPDGTERHINTKYVKVETIAPDVYLYYFEDSGSDMDLNDVVIKVDRRDCANNIFSIISLDAAWHHKVKLNILSGGVIKKQLTISEDTHLFEQQVATTVNTEQFRSELCVMKSKQICVFDCKTLIYDLYIINPDRTERHINSKYVRVDQIANDVYLYNFEDSGSDMDLNDVIMKVDRRDCSKNTFTMVSLDAAWHHQIMLRILDGTVLKKQLTISTDSHLAEAEPPLVIDTLAFQNELCVNRNVADIPVPPKPPTDYAIVYSEADFAGRSEIFAVGASDTRLADNVIGNDAISSFKLVGDAAIQLFEHDDFKGNFELLTADDSDLSNNFIKSKQASSLKVVNQTGHVNGNGSGTAILCGKTQTFTQYLAVGTNNSEVKALQLLLQCLNYFPKDIAPNGNFGPTTSASVKKFQSANGIGPVGYVGPATRAALNKY
jgi:hypothetical protein